MNNEKSTELIEIIPNENDLRYSNTDVITDIIYEGKTDVTLKDLEYMCKYMSSYKNCNNCILYPDSKHCPYVVMIKLFGGDVNNLNNSILAWLNDNPPLSYLMDIKTRMPSVQLVSPYNTPKFCLKSIYGEDAVECKLDTNEESYDASKIKCRECWRTPIHNNKED